jgi:predicted nucleic acid-binding protein
MRYLLDTNVVSDLVRQPPPSSATPPTSDGA